VNFKREDGSEGTSFRVGRIFDINQTHGDPIAPVQKQVIELDQLVRMMVEKSPVRVIADQTISAQHGALFDPASKSIRVRSDLPDAVAVEVLAREMSHAALSTVTMTTIVMRRPLPAVAPPILSAKGMGMNRLTLILR